ncbi:MAG: glycoside hydrolase [Candidatus Zixiibacteriota bacterium]|nr:MAG: glycoside hydrolase [candidate division Zixibacteria bacterium]
MPRPIRIAILWHMHQPDYREPDADRLAMPWVRLHAVKDYLDMPLMAARYESVRTTFNLVPSLLDQLQLYLDGGTDRHLELSRKEAESLEQDERLEILESFFVGHTKYLIEPYPRYRSLYGKYQSGKTDREKLPQMFSTSEIRDLQVWSNLTWTDPLFRTEDPISSLFSKGRHFAEDEKQALLDWQLDIIGRIVPAYKRLLDDGRIEVSFTPYYHPILPLLCDTRSALEAIPSLKLPEKHFAHPEDARSQVRMAAEKYQSLFGRKLAGMWPSEGSISEEALQIIAEEGILWAASDQQVLAHSLVKSGHDRRQQISHTVFEFCQGLRLFFRDHALSDRIGFVYSGWPAELAVADFLEHIKSLRRLLHDRLDKVVVPIILDGENAWEYFPNDGMGFLDRLYREIDSDPEIATVTYSEAVEQISPTKLEAIFAGSWINHNFRIWIGHAEDNTAWDLLGRARDAVTRFEVEHSDAGPDKLRKVWDRIFVAEGSDWCWWYGDEHHSEQADEFDRIFRGHLQAVYDELGLPVPSDLLKPIHGGGSSAFVDQPNAILTAQIDGQVSHFYEWTGAGFLDCAKAAGAMHRVDRLVAGLYFAFDHNRFYIRLDFHNKKAIESLREHKVVVELFAPAPKLIELELMERDLQGERPGEFQFAADDILELAIERRYIWLEEFGQLGFSVSIYRGESKLESWPEQEPIQVDVPERNKEMFWPS